MSSNTKIRISRSKYIERDRSIAILRLDAAEHLLGQPIMVRYYTDSTQSEYDTIFAMGIKDGIGKDCYKIISLGGLELVRNVVTELPDVSALVHGELYLYEDQASGKWYYVYEVGNERQLDEIIAPPTIYVNIEDKYRWFWRDGKLRKEDDFYTTQEIDNLAEELLAIFNPPVIEIQNNTGYIFEAGTTQDIEFKVSVINGDGINITSKCEIYLDDKRIHLGIGNYYTLSKVNTTHDYKIVAKYKLNGKDFFSETILSIKFGYNVYYGVVPEDWNPTPSNIVLLENKELQVRSNIKYSGINLDQEKTVFAYPEVFGDLVHIYDINGLDYISDYNIHKVVMGKTETMYNVYVKKYEVSISDFVQVYKFIDEDLTEDILYSRLKDLEKAWLNQNGPEGVVLLDGTGKLPENIIPENIEISGGGNSGGGVNRLIKFIDSYPQYNMIPGQMWYNTKTKKIFTALTDNTGEISDPESDAMYLNSETNALFIWNAVENNMDSLGGTVMSTKLTDLSEIL